MLPEELLIHSDKLFADRYRITRLLGKGGMGVVYLAEDTMLENEAVALKIIHHELSSDLQQRKRFMREIRIARKVTHGNVVRTFEAGVENEQLYFTMEYVDDYTLADLLSEGALPANDAIDILREICKGLDAIHKAGIVHRDLKPANVIITKDAFLKIADFGIAHPGVSDITDTQEVVGSALYIAPEAWENNEAGPPADAYALGVILYEMLCGSPPFEGTVSHLMYAHLHSQPMPPLKLRADLPRWLNQLTLDLLEKDPKVRPDCRSILKRIERHFGKPEEKLPEEQAAPERSPVTYDYMAPELPRSQSGRSKAKGNHAPFIDNPEGLTPADSQAPESSPRKRPSSGLQSWDSESPHMYAPHKSGSGRAPQFGESYRASSEKLKRPSALLSLARSCLQPGSLIQSILNLGQESAIGVRLISLLTGIGAFGFLTFFPGLEIAAELLASYSLELSHNMLAIRVLTLLAFCSLAISFPIFALALFNRVLPGATLIWIAACLSSLLLSLLLVGYYSQGMEFQVPAGKTQPGSAEILLVNKYEKARYLLAAKPALVNLFEAAALSPSGTTYKVINEGEIPHFERLKGYLFFHELKAYYLTLAMMMLIILGFARFGMVVYHCRLNRILMNASCLILPSLLLIENYYEAQITRFFNWSSISEELVQVAGLQIFSNPYAIFCSKLNWGFMLLIYGIAIPLVTYQHQQKRRLEAESASMARPSSASHTKGARLY